MSCKDCCDIRNIALDAFCLYMCNRKPPRKTCTSLGTCDKYDEFNRLLHAKFRESKCCDPNLTDVFEGVK